MRSLLLRSARAENGPAVYLVDARAPYQQEVREHIPCAPFPPSSGRLRCGKIRGGSVFLLLLFIHLHYLDCILSTDILSTDRRAELTELKHNIFY